MLVQVPVARLEPCDHTRGSGRESVWQGTVQGKVEVAGKQRRKWLVRFVRGEGVVVEKVVHGKSMAPASEAAHTAAEQAAEAEAEAEAEEEEEEEEAEEEEPARVDGDEEEGADPDAADAIELPLVGEVVLPLAEAGAGEHKDTEIGDNAAVAAAPVEVNAPPALPPPDVVARVQPVSGAYYQDWKDAGVVSEDARTAEPWGAHLNWGDGEAEASRTPLDYFLLMFPTEAMPGILEASAQRMRAGRRPPTEAELWKMFGLLIAMTFTTSPTGDLRGYWAQEGGALNPLLHAPNFGRFMPRDRFQELMSCFSLPGHDADARGEDHWEPVRRFIDAWNANRERVFSPSYMLSVNESFCEWHGLDGRTGETGMAHAMQATPKAKGVGAQIRNVACAKSGIMLRLEVVESKQAEARKEYCRDRAGMPAGTAQVLRLTKPWAGRPFVVCADSAFASVTTATALMSEHGMYFVGLVKAAHSRFPKDYLNTVQTEGCGHGKTLKTTADHYRLADNKTKEVDVLAHLWDDTTVCNGRVYGKRKLFVATCGKNTPGEPHQKTRRRRAEDGRTETYTKEVPRQHLVSLYFGAAPAIDGRNQHRQGSLAVEQPWETKTWYHRVFASVGLERTATDAFLAYRQFHPQPEYQTHLEFTAALALALLTTHDANAQGSGEAVPANAAIEHDIGPLSELPKYSEGMTRGGKKKQALLKCAVNGCEHRSMYYCRTCSQGGQLIPLCGLKSGRMCIVAHAST